MEKYQQFYIETKYKLFGYLMRLTGDYQLSSDIMQESFTRLLSRYEAKEHCAALLFTIARNAVMDHERKLKRQRGLRQNQENDPIDPEKLMMVRETYRNVITAMQQLEKTERDILSLVISSGLPYREIAIIVGISEANVRVKVHRARTKLRKHLPSGDES